MDTTPTTVDPVDTDPPADPDPVDVDPPEGDPAPSPPTTVARAELDKVIRERQAAKQKLRDAQQRIADMTKANEDESAKATREAREAALSEADKRYKPLIIRTSAKAELVAAGVRADKVARLTKLLDLDEIEVEDDGSVSGLAEQVTALKEEWPELFEETKPRKATSKAADGAAKPPATKKPRTEDLLVARLRGE